MGRQPVPPSFVLRLAATGLALALASIAAPATLRASEPEPAGQRIVGITVSGNARVNTNRILGQMRLREGSVYNPTTQDEDVKRIYALGDFDDVRIDPQPGPEGLTLLVKVKERPTLEKLVFLGNRKFSDKDLSDTVGLSSGSILDRSKLFSGLQAILRQYRDAGYYFVHVALDGKLLSESRIAQYTITEGPAVRISAIEFTGNASIDSSELKNQMESKAYFPIFSSGTLDEDQLDRDMAAVRTYYIDQGFRDVRVDRVLDFSPDKTRLVVRVIIDEGPRYHVRSVALQGVQRFAPSLLEQQMAVKPGAPYTADAMKHDITLIHDTYGEVGFIDTTIEPIVDFTSEPGTVDVTLKVAEGRLVTIGDIRVEGNRLTQDKVIRRELAIYPEEPVNTKLIDQAKRRLEGTGLFSPGSVEITPIATSSPDVVNLVVRVEEAQMNRLILGAGISSNEGVIGNISLVERNFDLAATPRSADEFWRGESFRGAGQTLQLVLEPGTEVQQYRIDFRDPHLADTDYGLSTSLFYFKRIWETYDENRGGLDVGIGKQLWPNVQGFVNLRLEAIDIDSISATAPPDVLKVAGGSTLTSLAVGLTRDTTDSQLFPTEGYRLTGSIEQAGALGGSYSFTKVIVDARKYWTVTRDVLDRRSVFSVRGTVADILGGDAPIFERLFAGGEGTIRGFKFRGVGPREDDTALGGDFMALASAEYVFPIYEKTLSGVLFLDTGTVEPTISASTWRASMGFGVRFTVPFFGPVPFSLDFGFPLMKASGDKTEIISFSVGASF